MLSLKQRQAILALPKADLHCHLDGSMRPQTIMEIAQEENISLGVNNIEQLKEKLVCGKKVKDLPEFLQAFDITCSVLQTKKAIARITFELVEDAFLEGVTHLEIRYSPILMQSKGLTMDEAVEAVYQGMQLGQKKYPGIRATQIICALRVMDPKISLDLALLALRHKHHGVVGFDLAHAEKGFLPSNHAYAFEVARQGGLHATVHAGEAAGPDSILDAIRSCHAERLGHGLTLQQDRGLENLVREKGIVIECCPSSNVQINLLNEWSHHPVKGYLERGLLATLNTDNRLLTGITLGDEYLRAAEYLDLSWEQLTTLANNSLKAVFKT